MEDHDNVKNERAAALLIGEGHKKISCCCSLLF